MSQATYDIRKLKLEDVQAQEKESLRSEKHFTIRDIEETERSMRILWAVGGWGIGMVTASILFMILESFAKH